MAGLNEVKIIGRLGNDPEVKVMPSGDAVCNISMATSETWTDKNTGGKQEATEWHRVVFFGKVAEIAGKYLRKGAQCYVSGKLKTRKWQNQQGVDMYTTEIVVDSFNGKLILLESKPQGETGQPAQQQNQRPNNAAAQQRPQQQPAAGFDSFDDDIPF
jgi:single-strand DNA-binding protein